MKLLFLDSLGIIGGADGPTTVFVTTTVDSVAWLAAILVLVSAGLIFWRNHRRK